MLTNDYEGVDYIDPNYGPQMELRFLNLIVLLLMFSFTVKQVFDSLKFEEVSILHNLFTEICHLQEIMRYANIDTR